MLPQIWGFKLIKIDMLYSLCSLHQSISIISMAAQRRIAQRRIAQHHASQPHAAQRQRQVVQAVK